MDIWDVINQILPMERMQSMHMTSQQPNVPNNETLVMLVYQTNPVEVKLFSFVNTFFWSNKFAWC